MKQAKMIPRIRLNTKFSSYLNYIINFFSTNKKRDEFESMLKKFLNVKNLFLVSQGRVALFNILKVIKHKTGKKEILLSPYTLSEVVNAIIYAGCKPIFIDIDIKTGLINEIKLKKKINKNTAAVLITHLYSSEGNLINFFKKFKKKILIIEDCAINFGAEIKKNKLGTIGDYGFYSFGMVKNLCCFNGGAITYKNNKDKLLFERELKNLKKYPHIKFFQVIFKGLIIDILFYKYIYYFSFYLLKIVYTFKFNFFYKAIYPASFNTFQKTIPTHYFYDFYDIISRTGIENLKNIKKDKKIRLKKIKLYKKYLSKKHLEFLNFDTYKENMFLEYPVLLKKQNIKIISEYLLKHNIDIRNIWYVNNAKFKFYKDTKKYAQSNLVESNILLLPTHEWYNENEIKKLCYLINKI